MASLRQWETLQAKVKEILNSDCNSCDIRLVQRMASICLQVSDRDYQPSMSDWSRLIQTLQVPLTICSACCAPLRQPAPIFFGIIAFSLLEALLTQAGPLMGHKIPDPASPADPTQQHSQQQQQLAEQFKQQVVQSGLPKALSAEMNDLANRLKAAAADSAAAQWQSSATWDNSSSSGGSNSNSSSNSSSGVDEYKGLICLVDLVLRVSFQQLLNSTSPLEDYYTEHFQKL